MGVYRCWGVAWEVKEDMEINGWYMGVEPKIGVKPPNGW